MSIDQTGRIHTASWISLTVPILAAIAAYAAAFFGNGTIPDSMLWIGLIAGGIGLIAGIVSFFGTNAVRSWRALLVTIFGLLVSLGVLALAAMFLVLTGLPGP